MTIKTALHPRNKHRSGYDFATLKKANPSLSPFIIKNKYNQQDTIDFSNASAVKALNVALLKTYYQIEHWDFPQGYLCPPIPGRVDYIHYLADLLKEDKITTKRISVLDIGTGATCIYPMLGARAYGWHFVASDIDPVSVNTANLNVNANKTVAKHITCRLQNNSEHIFQGIINTGEYYHLTLCNPPFHKSLEEASSGTNRKWQNLQKGKKTSNERALNFGGQKAELWCHGGELAFIQQMISESKKYQTQVGWFTCLVSKKEHLSKIKLYLKKAQVSKVNVINMAQGQKISRFVAWQFTKKQP
ncbi:23S rRNA (adenine(1618)-N(6))-methyltransferase RlmF [Colwellia sp. MSW7]|jgi:23S rRNA (adenine1618-N6)-methyltransferase|uniref:Ribosomal RNA large subunit methyltransferase F n=1 Tax=Colwellia maritima TaxID=2912588 RepID=A0ABS9X2K1_9GAMM|nr:23S rRNA (adenine(1618)-N(6))-methyltransferase RlmF [Colwellia maritima]MCI2284022.1 23S rRNA (adenine(1618)-N(6))-methyltransferase RlmF [Colwellia maritima]